MSEFPRFEANRAVYTSGSCVANTLWKSCAYPVQAHALLFVEFRRCACPGGTIVLYVWPMWTVMSFAGIAEDFVFATLVGSSQQVIAKRKSHQSHVALISAELQDGPQAGFKVLQNLRTSRHHAAAIILLQSSNSDIVVNAFRAWARGVFLSQPLLEKPREMHTESPPGTNLGQQRRSRTHSRPNCPQFPDKDGNQLVDAPRGRRCTARRRRPQESRNS